MSRLTVDHTISRSIYDSIIYIKFVCAEESPLILPTSTVFYSFLSFFVGFFFLKVEKEERGKVEQINSDWREERKLIQKEHEQKMKSTPSFPSSSTSDLLLVDPFHSLRPDLQEADDRLRPKDDQTLYLILSAIEEVVLEEKASSAFIGPGEELNNKGGGESRKHEKDHRGRERSDMDDDDDDEDEGEEDFDSIFNNDKDEREEGRQLLDRTRITNNEYFAAIMMALETGVIGQRENMYELVTLLSMLIDHVDSHLLQTKFKPMSMICVKILQLYDPKNKKKNSNTSSSTMSGNNVSDLYSNSGGSNNDSSQIKNTSNALTRKVLYCMGSLFQQQEMSKGVWQNAAYMQVFQASLLNYIHDGRPKVRKECYQVLIKILTTHHRHQFTILSKYISQIFLEELRQCTSSQYLEAFHIISFLAMENAMSSFPLEIIMNFSEHLLHIYSFNNNHLKLASIQVLKSLTRNLAIKLDPENLMEILISLLDLQPLSTERDNIPPFLDVLVVVCQRLNTEINFHRKTNKEEIDQNHIASKSDSSKKKNSTKSKKDKEINIQDEFDVLLPRCLTCIVSYYENDLSAIQNEVTSSLRFILATCLPQKHTLTTTVNMNVSTTTQHQSQSHSHSFSKYQEIIPIFESLLTYRFQSAWLNIFTFLGNLFAHFKEDSVSLLDSLLLKLIELHDGIVAIDAGEEIEQSIRSTISVAIESMGIENFLTIIPIFDEQNNLKLIEDTKWLLPILRDAGRQVPSQLSFFVTTIYASISNYDEEIKCKLSQQQQQKQQENNKKKLNNNDNNVKPVESVDNEIQLLRFTVLQLWSLLPAFTGMATDASSTFPVLAPILGKILSDKISLKLYPELLVVICTSLRSLIEGILLSPFNADDMTVVGSIGERFLPTLFTLLDTTMDQENPDNLKVKILADTISTYAPLCSSAVVNGTWFKKVCMKILESTKVNDILNNSSNMEDGNGMDVTNSSSSAFSSSKGKGKNMTNFATNRAITYCELALALLPALELDSCIFFYRVIKPLIQFDGNPALQKRAYRILSCLLCNPRHEQQEALNNNKVDSNIQRSQRSEGNYGFHNDDYDDDDSLMFDRDYDSSNKHYYVHKYTQDLLYTIVAVDSNNSATSAISKTDMNNNNNKGDNNDNNTQNNTSILEELLVLLTTGLLSCPIQARSMRLKCLKSLIVYLDLTNNLTNKVEEGTEHMQYIVTLMGEILLCLKDSNAKAREEAYSVILTIANYFLSPENDLQINSFLEIILGSFAAMTATMRSAGVLALCRILYEKSHDPGIYIYIYVYVCMYIILLVLLL